MKAFKLGLVALLFLLTVSSALAAVEVNTASLTKEINFDMFKDNEKEYSFTHDVTIKNTGSSTEQITLAIKDVKSDYKAELAQTSLSLNAGDEDIAFDNLSVTGTSPVPVPAAIWLLLSGIGALGVMRRKV